MQERPETNYLPDYIPPHLQGKVSDFRREPDGTVSFIDHFRPSGLSGAEQNRTKLSPEDFSKTFDRSYRLSTPDSWRGGYGGVDSWEPKTSAQQLQANIARWMGKKWDWANSSQGKSTLTAGALTALAGGGFGAYRAMRDDDPQSSGPLARGLLYALLAGAAGAGVTALAQNRADRTPHYSFPGFGQRKSATVKAASASGAVMMAIAQDPSLSQAQKAAVIEVLRNMPGPQRQDTFAAARRFAGVGIGIAVARVLLGKGLLPSVVGGMLGLALSGGGQPRIERNALGQIRY